MKPIICGLDLETTGLDLQNDKIVELSWVFAEAGTSRVLSGQSHMLLWPDCHVPDEVAEINGITDHMLARVGRGAQGVLDLFVATLDFFGPVALVAHNGENFDKPMLTRVCPPAGEYHWIDTRADVDYPDRWGRSLMVLAAESGFLNPFPHNGLSDVMTMLKILAGYDFDAVLARSKEPFVTLRAIVSYDDRDKAKAQRFSWETVGDKKYPKCWVKRVKQGTVQKEMDAAKTAGFEIGVVV